MAIARRECPCFRSPDTLSASMIARGRPICWPKSARVRHASTHSLHNEIPFELGDRANYVKQKLSGRCRGVDALSETDEINAQRAELLQAVDEVFKRASKASEFPDQDDIKQTLTCSRHQRIQLGSLTLSPADPEIDELVVASKPLFGIPAQVP